MRTRFCLAAGFALLVAITACAGPPGAPDAGRVIAVTISDSSERMIVVQTEQQLTATVETVGGASRSVRWFTSDDAVVRVNADGRVRAVGFGAATVTAVSDVSPSAQASVRFEVVERLPRAEEIGLSTSEVGALVARRPVAVENRVTPDGTWILTIARVNVRLTALRSSRASRTAGIATAGLQVAAGRQFSLSAQGYQPGSLLGVWLVEGEAHRWLDSARVSEAGSLALTVTIPRETPEGPTVLLWTGVNPEGQSLEVAVAIVVSAADSDLGDGADDPFEVRVHPAMPEVVVGGVVAFTALTERVSVSDIAWRLFPNDCGSIDGDGVYQAPLAPAACTIVATVTAAEGVVEGRTSAMVVAELPADTPIELHLLPYALNVPAAGAVTLAAIAPGAAATGVTWSSSCGTVAGEGFLVTFKAPANPGVCSVMVELSDAPTVTRQVSLRVTPAGSDDGAHFTQLSVFYEHVLALDAFGNAWGWGPNHNDQLGSDAGSFAATPTPVQMPVGIRFQAVQAGGGHSLALDQHGNAWGWGWNATGEVGRGNNQWTSRPTAVVMPAGVSFVALAAGASHSLALDSRGHMWAWGSSEFGQLGDGSQVWRVAPVRVAAPPEVVFTAIAAGWLHSAALDSTGRIWTWGHDGGSQGRLGSGGGGDRAVPAPLVVVGDPTFVAVAAGADHSLAIDARGVAWAWGVGPSGDGSTEPRVVPTPVGMPPGATFERVAGGLNHSLAVDTAGGLWAWGENSRGALGLGDDASRFTPTAVRGVPAEVVWAAAGTGNTFVLLASGEAWSWGFNGFSWSPWDDRSGLLGRGAGPDQFTPRRIAASLPQLVAALELVAGGDARATVNTTVPVPPAVRVLGEAGEPLAGVEVTFVVVAGGGIMVPANGVVVSDAFGVATLDSWRLGTLAGPQALRLSAGGRMLEVVAEALPGEASIHTSWLRADPAVLAAGAVTPAVITLQLKDAFGNALLGSGASVAFERQPPVGALGEVVALGDGAYAVTLSAPADPLTLIVRARVNDALVSGSVALEIVNEDASTFFLDANGVTVRCPFAVVGESAEVAGVTFTKRAREEITPANAATTCTSGITDMSYLFFDQPGFDADISSWDTSSVTSMAEMFTNAQVFNADIGAWKLSNVTHTNSMFYGARAFNRSIASWDMGNVVSMRAMFAYASAFNQDIGAWDTSRVRDLSWMFLSASAFNRDLSAWCVADLESFDGFDAEATSWLLPRPEWGSCP
jgi:surface protein